jgi:hypothetical protein
MTDFLAAFPAPAPQRAWNPLPTAPRTDLERMDLQWQSYRLTDSEVARERALYDAFEVARESYRRAGHDLPNPYAGYFRPPVTTPAAALNRLLFENPARQAAFTAWDDAHQRLAAGDQAAQGLLPSRTEIEERARARARAASQEARMAAEAGGGGLGGFIGEAGAALLDPSQLMTLPIGAPMRIAGALPTRIFTTAVIEGAIAAGTQGLVELRASPWRVEIGVPNDSAGNIAVAAAGGALLGGGLRAIAEGVRAVWGRAPLPPGHPGAEAHATATLADAQLMSDLRNAAGPEGVAAHRAAADAAGDAVVSGVVPPVTASARPPRVPLLDLAPDATDAIQGEVTRMLRIRTGSFGVRLGTVPPDVAARMPTDLPVPIEGFSIVMRSDEVRHAWNRHGPDGASITVRPITEEDLAQASNWFLTADRYDFAGYSRQGLPVIQAEKVLADGTIAVIEEVRAGRQQLAFKSLYFVRGGEGGAPGAATSGPSPGLRPPSRPQREPGGAASDVSPDLARFNAYTPAGRAVLVEPQVMELDSLIASHLPDGAANPAFPHGEGVQPRDRGAAPSRDQVRAIAATLNPERLRPNPEAGFGAPIVAADNVVESGNGRVMALRTAFDDPALAEQAGAYRAWLEAQGFDLTGFERPVLVSRRVSALSPAERASFVREANGRGTLAQAAAELARQDARAIDDALPLWRGGEVDSLANAPFVQRFLAGLTAEERGSLIRADRTLSAEGARRIQAAILARAYGDELGPLLERFLEADADGLKAIAGALQDVAGRWAQLRRDVAAGAINPAMDVTADLAAAVRAVDNARRLKMPVADLLAQGDLDATPLSDTGLAMLAMMFREPGFRAPAGRDRLVARLTGFLEEAEKSRPGLDLFGTPPAAPGEVLAAGGRRADALAPGDTPPMSAEPIAPAPPRATFDFAPPTRQAPPAPPVDPERVTRAAVLEASRADEAVRESVAAALPDATVQQARRIAAARDIAVPLADDAGEALDVAGAAATRGARELLDEADDRVAAAAQAAACLVGSAA